MTYTRDVKHLDKIDIYRILDLYGANHSCNMRLKNYYVLVSADIKMNIKIFVEAAKSIDRWLDMRREDNNEPCNISTSDI